MNKDKVMSKRCIYCKEEVAVIAISVREIEGYRNALTGKNTAIIEKLSCGHEFVDGKFNIDAVYFSQPKIKPQSDAERFPQNPVPVHIEVVAPPRKSNNVTVMDILCLGCLVLFLVTIPPLAILPIVYFIGRLLS